LLDWLRRRRRAVQPGEPAGPGTVQPGEPAGPGTVQPGEPTGPGQFNRV